VRHLLFCKTIQSRILSCLVAKPPLKKRGGTLVTMPPVATKDLGANGMTGVEMFNLRGFYR
jgi:hypothetical protein